jgi:hypothetical protein
MSPDNLELLNNCVWAVAAGIFVGVLAALLAGAL